MNKKKLHRTIWILLSAGMIFLLLLGYLNLAIFQLKEDKLKSETGQIASETFFSIPYNNDGLLDLVDEIFADSLRIPDKQELKNRLQQIFNSYSMAGDSVEEAIVKKGIPARINWSVSIPRFEIRGIESPLRLIHATADRHTELILFGDPQIGTKATKYLFYKIGEAHYAQINLYIELNNSFAILQSQMLPIILIDLILLLLFGGALAYTIHALFQQKRVADLQTDFINGVSHEFNTPLSSIQLAGQTLLKLNPDQLTQRSQEIGESILRQQNHLKKMVDQVLTVTVSENPFTSLDFDWYPVPDRLVTMISEWNEGQSGVDIHFKMGGQDGLWARFDRHLLMIVIHNILDNAVKHNPSVEKSIFVSDDIHGDMYSFMIADNGPGIPEEELDKVMKKFHRGQNAGKSKSKGLGLGLYLVKLIMDLHDGKVNLSSQLNKGTHITLSFPIKHERVV